MTFRRPFPIVAGLLLVLGLAQMRWGERVPLGEGAGWDGKQYAAIARDLPRLLAERGLDQYRLRRIGPSALVGVLLRALRLEPSLSNLSLTFSACNLGFLLLTAWCWAGIARQAGLRENAEWLGHVLLFVSLANLKMPFYYPVLTDTAALALGALLVYFHLRDRTVAMWLVLAASAFTWPALAVFGASLFLFRPGTLEATPAPVRKRRVLGLAAVATYLAVFALYGADLGRRPPVLLAAGLMVAAVYVYAVADLLGRTILVPVPSLLARLHPWRLAVLVVTAVAVEWAIARLGTPAPYDAGYFLGRLSFYSAAFPGLFLVGHAVYLGLAWPLLVALGPRLRPAAQALGPGLILFVCAHLLWGLYPESRTVIGGLPALALLVTLAAQGLGWPGRWVAALAAVAFAGSKVWLPINRPLFGSAGFPHRYFMNYGPWMTAADYAWQGAAALIVTLALFALVTASPAARTPEARPSSTAS